MNLKQYNVQAKIPKGKALVYEQLKDGDFVIDIGERIGRTFKGLTRIISNTIIRIPKSTNKDEYWQKINRVKDFQRIKDTLKKYVVAPIFEVQEYSFLGKKVISRLSEKDTNYLTSILN